MGEPIPHSVRQTWPHVPAGAWERRSAHRYRAPHNLDGHIWCVVVAFGETIGRGCRRGDEATVAATLFQAAARLGAHRMACQDGTPVVHLDDEANLGVTGRCWWCGKWPTEHLGPDDDSGEGGS